MVIGHTISGTKNLKDLQIWPSSVFKDFYNQILNNCNIKGKRGKGGEHAW